mmetsp:Transcript_31259/g.74548  ORF Transcript_31259/g.74548 Transcript_31259/m.74548 type:complete len:253 (-) Transcript_31259:640-1398(-)
MKAGSAAIASIPAGQVVGQALLHQLHSILVVVHACVGGALHTNSKSVLAGDSGKVLCAGAAASVADLAQVEVQDANLLDKVHRVGAPLPVGAVASSHRPRMVRRGATEGVSEQVVSCCWNVDPPGANSGIRLDVRITGLTGTTIATNEAGWLRERAWLGLHGCQHPGLLVESRLKLGGPGTSANGSVEAGTWVGVVDDAGTLKAVPSICCVEFLPSHVALVNAMCQTVVCHATIRAIEDAIHLYSLPRNVRL